MRIPGLAARLLALVAAVSTPIAFQLGGGLHDVGVVEEWGVYTYYDLRGVVYWTPSDPQLTTQSIRPLTVLPHSIAYLLDPNGFVGLQLVQAAAMGLQGLAMLLLLRALGLGDVPAVAGAVLFGVFPAWDASYTLRAVHMHWALAFLVLALWLLVELGGGPMRLLLAIPMVAALTVSLFLYEAGYVAAALAPALLLVAPVRPSRRALLAISAIWYAAPFANGLRILWLLTSGQQLYQKSIAEHARHNYGGALREAVRHVLTAAWSPLTPPRGFAIGGVAVLALAVGAAAVVAAPARSGATSGRASRAWLAVGALAAAPLTILVFTPQPALLADPLRVFSIGSVPLSIAVAAAASLVPGLVGRRLVAVGLVALTAFAAQAERAYWHRRSSQQAHVLGAIVGALPAHLPPGAPIAVYDRDVRLSRDVYSLPGVLLTTALRYVRHDPALDVHVCAIPGRAPIAGLTEACSLTSATATLGVEQKPRAMVTAVDLYAGRHGATEPPVPLTDRERRAAPCAAAGTCARGATGMTAVLVPG